MRFIVYGARTESVPEVLVVLVVGIWLLGVDATLRVGFGVDAKGAFLLRSKSCCAAIASKVALLEDLDQVVFAMALNGARIAYTGWVVWIGWVRRGRITS